RRFEVPTPPATNSVRNFKSKSGTRIIELLVPLYFRSSCQSVLRCITNFGNGALAPATQDTVRTKRGTVGFSSEPRFDPQTSHLLCRRLRPAGRGRLLPHVPARVEAIPQAVAGRGHARSDRNRL